MKTPDRSEAEGATANLSPSSEETQIKIRRLAIEPPNSVIPELQRFRDAPYKFTRIAAYYYDKEERDIVFENEGAIISTLCRKMVFRTRKHGNYYEIPLKPEDFPPELKYYVDSFDFEGRAVVFSFDELVLEWIRKQVKG